MATPGFLDQNTGRTYPLVADGSQLGSLLVAGTPLLLPESAIVDFGCAFSSDAAFNPTASSVYLMKIARVGPLLTFSFGLDVGQLGGLTLDFTRSVTDSDFTTSFAQVSGLSACAGGPAWEGWLTTGPLAALVADLPSGDTFVGGTTFALEPALALNLSSSNVRSISVANTPRTYAGPAPAAPTDGLHVVATCLHALTLSAGYNTEIRVDPRANGFVITSADGSGLGRACSDVPRYPGESPLSGSPYLGGGPGCGSLVVAINGVMGSSIQLENGQGVSIRPDPNNAHTVLIDFDLHDLANCP
jgi:hypothetical protein